MIIKCGRKEFEVTEKDLILDNEMCYILITQKVFSNWSSYSPVVSKTLFKKLLKEGKIKKSVRKWKYRKGYTEIGYFDLYEFVEER